jgi:hypothetical protein
VTGSFVLAGGTGVQGVSGDPMGVTIEQWCLTFVTFVSRQCLLDVADRRG